MQTEQHVYIITCFYVAMIAGFHVDKQVLLLDFL